MVASYLHLLFSHSVTSLQYFLPDLSKNAIIVPGLNVFVIVSSIRVLCGPDPAVHLCQLGVGDNSCQMFKRRVKRKWEPGVNLTIASHLEFIMVAYEQKTTDF